MYFYFSAYGHQRKFVVQYFCYNAVIYGGIFYVRQAKDARLPLHYLGIHRGDAVFHMVKLPRGRARIDCAQRRRDRMAEADRRSAGQDRRRHVHLRRAQDGAFHGIESIIKRRLRIGTSIGFTCSSQDQYTNVNLQSLVTNDDLVEWGYMPELLGRIGETIVMNPLTQDVIYEIMTSAKENILQSHIDYCSKNNIDLHFSDEALYYIAGEAQRSGLGFRNVKTILSKALNRLYFEMPNVQATQEMKTIEISKEYVMNTICAKQL